MDALAHTIDDDPELDALMVRVRELALGTGPAHPAPAPAPAGDVAPGCDSDLIRVLDAQCEWNEQTRQALADVVQCLQTLRDDWTQALHDRRAELARRPARRRPATRRTTKRGKKRS